MGKGPIKLKNETTVWSYKWHKSNVKSKVHPRKLRNNIGLLIVEKQYLGKRRTKIIMK